MLSPPVAPLLPATAPPLIDGAMPDESRFVRVCCKDIGTDGFSFHTNEPPPSDSLIVALGSPPRFTYVDARVVRVTPVERRGHIVYLVGCSYAGQADGAGRESLPA